MFKTKKYGFKNMYLPRGILINFADKTGILTNNISSYLSGNRPMSKKRAITLEKASKDLGFEFTAEDWLFRPKKIKNELIKSSLK